MNDPSSNQRTANRSSCIKKRLLQVCSVVLLLLVLASCSSSRDSREGTFRVGMEAGYAPFNWTQMDDSNGAVRIEGTNQYAGGYDVQISKRIADHMNKDLVIVKVSWDGLPVALSAGQIDAIAAGMSATEERKKTIDFSDNYYYSDLVVVVRKDGAYASATQLSDFSSATITGQQGTLHYDVIDQIQGVKKDTPLSDFPTMIVALQAGKIDGYVSEEPGAISAAMANPSLTYVSFPKNEGFNFDNAEVSIGVGLRIGDPIKADINAALAEISPEERLVIMEKAIATQPAEGQEVASFGASFLSIVSRYWKHFLRGAGTTLVIALLGTILGLLIGLLVATFRKIPQEGNSAFRRGTHKVVSILLTTYVEIFRGTPMMVQAMVFYYGLSALFGLDLSPMVAGLIIVSINTGAYMSEVVRGGIESVDTGQFDATKAIGMTHAQSMRSVILPQAIRNILPATGNEFVINIKDTSVLNVIAVTELYFATRDVQANTMRMFETYLITAIIYFVLTFTITRILHAIERRMDGPKNYMLTSSSMPAHVALHQKQGRP